MNIRILLMVGFIIEILAETGFGFKRVIFTGFSLKNLLLFLLLIAVFTAGNKASERRKRFIYSKGIHRNYLLYLLTVILATTAAYIYIVFPHYDLIKVVMAIKSTILDPYLVFLIFLMYPRDKLEFEKIFKLITIFIVILSAMTILASVVSPGLFFGVDNDAARPNGPFGEPNQTSAVLSMILLIIIAPLVREENFTYKRIILGVIVLGCIIVTGSRGGLLATVLATAYFLFSIRKYIGIERKLGILISVILGVVITWLILPEHVHNLVFARLSIFDSSHIDWKQASAGRTYLWLKVFTMLKESPFFGYGWMGYKTIVGSPTHNSYLEILISSGPLGLIFYVLLVLNILRIFNKTARLKSTTDIILLKTFKSSFVALLLAIFFVNLYTPWLIIWALLGLMVGYGYTINNQDNEVEQPSIKENNTTKRILSFKKVKSL